jgi:chromosome segregation ATPase
LEQVNKKLLEEIKVYKDNLEEKTKEISSIKADLDNCEAELNKERNIYISLNKEFKSMIDNHEAEIKLRLQFESKLNNQTSIFKELESRFKTVSKEFVINNERQKELFDLLAQLRQDNSTISARNNELELENKILVEKFKMNKQIVDQMNNSKESYEKELKNLNNEVLALRSERNDAISKNKDLEITLSFKKDE